MFKVFKMFDRTIEQWHHFCILSNKTILTVSSVVQGNYTTIRFSPIPIQLSFIHPFIHSLPLSLLLSFLQKTEPETRIYVWKFWREEVIPRNRTGRPGTEAKPVHCQEPAWGTLPMAKVMREEAWHMQRRDQASGNPLSQAFTSKTRVYLLYCFMLSPTRLTLWGGGRCSPLVLSEKE